MGDGWKNLGMHVRGLNCLKTVIGNVNPKGNSGWISGRKEGYVTRPRGTSELCSKAAETLAKSWSPVGVCVSVYIELLTLLLPCHSQLVEK